MKENYLVTIGVTTFNSNLNFLSQTIDSIINQTYKNLEIIVYDDCSENYFEIETLIRNKKDKRITIFKNEKNLGVSNSLNQIVKKTKGDFFCWCPDDDFMSLSRVQKQIKSVEKNPEFISYCNHYQIIELFKLNRKIKHKHYLKFFDTYFYSIIFDRINGGTLLIPSKIIKNYEFDINLKHIQDYDIWHKLFKDHKTIFLNEFLFYSRKHNQQASNLKSDESIKEISKYYNKFIKNNLFNLNYFYGKKGFFLIYMCFVFRGISAYKFMSDYLTLKNYINPFFKINYFFKFNLKISKFAGLTLQYFQIVKNFLLYNILYKSLFSLIKNK